VGKFVSLPYTYHGKLAEGFQLAQATFSFKYGFVLETA